MNTLILNADESGSIRTCADIIRQGGLCAFPTETVYGLGANGLDKEAVEKIFKAKGRPQDNPLILHVSSFEEACKLWREIPMSAYKLAEVFWPGPLTIICKKSDIVPDVVCAGLDTVAVRMPSNSVAHGLIERAQVPIAAPSANLSGKPSPTESEHVVADMTGRIDAILCGSSCKYGVESTVISLENEPVILRPGAITPMQISACIGEVKVSGSVLSPLKNGEKVQSPGMKYKHYSPDAKVLAFSGNTRELAEKICREYDKHKADRCIILASEECALAYGDRNIEVIGQRRDPYTLCSNLFSAFRRYNGYDYILCETVEAHDAGLAYMNRLLRACGFDVM